MHTTTKYKKSVQENHTVNSGVSGVENGSLGIYAILCSSIKKGIEESSISVDEDTGECLGLTSKSIAKIKRSRSYRGNLRGASKGILYRFFGDETPINKDGFKVYHRTCTCGITMISNTVDVVKSGKVAGFSGVSTCSNAATCPVCAGRINECKASELRLMASQAKEKGLNVSLLTLTAPHGITDSIKDLLDKMTKSLRRFWMSKAGVEFKDEYKIIGNIKSLEILYGKNGWHPHFHLLVVSEKQLPTTTRKSKKADVSKQSQEWLDILANWQAAAESAGLGKPNDHGLDIQDGSNAGEYISKLGNDFGILNTVSGEKIKWDMMDEMTKGNERLRSKGSRTPFGLLADTIDDSASTKVKNKAAELFLDYARAIKGKSLLRWSKGLRGYFNLGQQVTDEKILEDGDEASTLVCRILPEEWKTIVRLDHGGLVLDRAEDFGSSGVCSYLYSINGNNAVCYGEFEEDFNSRIDNRIKLELVKNEVVEIEQANVVSLDFKGLNAVNDEVNTITQIKKPINVARNNVDSGYVFETFLTTGNSEFEPETFKINMIAGVKNYIVKVVKNGVKKVVRMAYRLVKKVVGVIC